MKNKIKITLHPFSYLDFSEKTNAIFLLTFLACQFFMLFITNSWANLFVILAAVAATVLAEVFEKTYGKRKDSYSFLNSIIQGILTGLFLPSTFPVLCCFFYSFFCICLFEILYRKFCRLLDKSSLSFCLHLLDFGNFALSRLAAHA